MKKSLFLFVAAFLATTAVAQTADKGQSLWQKNAADVQQSFNLDVLHPSSASLFGSVKHIEATNDSVIENQPAGKLHTGYLRTGKGSYAVWSGDRLYNDEGGIGRFVEGDDGFLYLKEAISSCPAQSWLKLTPDGNGRYTAKMPQLAYVGSDWSGNQYFDYLTKMVYDSTAQTYHLDTLADGTVDYDIHYELVNDTLRLLDTDPKGAVLALMGEDGSWARYYEYGTKIYPMPYPKVTLPEGAQPVDYILTSSSDAQQTNYAMTKVAFVDNDVYVNDPTSVGNNRWFKGTIKGDKVVFMSKQFLETDTTVYDCHRFFNAGSYHQAHNDTYGYDYFANQVEDSLVMTYDAATKQMFTNDSVCWLFSYATDFYFSNDFPRPHLTPYVDKPYVPTDAVFTQRSGNVFTFNINPFDRQSNFLNPSNIYYNIFYDDPTTPETLLKEDYTAFSEDMTNIPYYFNDGKDIYCSAAYHMFTSYVEAFDSIGVRVTYVGGGTETHSNIVWCYSEDYAAGIEGVASNPSAVKAVAYYDLSGRRVERPVGGLYLKETVYADGKKDAEKVIIRR